MEEAARFTGNSSRSLQEGPEAVEEEYFRVQEFQGKKRSSKNGEKNGFRSLEDRSSSRGKRDP